MLGEPGVVTDPAVLRRLWVHEVMRVYYDRLVDDSDRAWIVSFLKETMTKSFDTNFDELFKKLDFNKDGGIPHRSYGYSTYLVVCYLMQGLLRKMTCVA